VRQLSCPSFLPPPKAYTASMDDWAVFQVAFPLLITADLVNPTCGVDAYALSVLR